MTDIKYHEDNGDIWFSYEERVPRPTKYHTEVLQIFRISGKIPLEIQKKGTLAIQKYAQRIAKRKISAQKKTAEKWQEYITNLNFPIETIHEDIVLKGRIVSAVDSALTVRLDEPYQGETFVIYGFASAMSGNRIFEDKSKDFTSYTLNKARQLLIQIYKQECRKLKHSKTIATVHELNGGKKVFPLLDFEKEK